MANELRQNLAFLMSLPVDGKGVFLDLLASVYPEQHADLMKELASLIARGELDLLVIDRCPRCRQHHARILCQDRQTPSDGHGPS